MICPYCQGNAATQSRHPVDPVKDTFRCDECGKQFYRYENTKYEQPGDPRCNESA